MQCRSSFDTRQKQTSVLFCSSRPWRLGARAAGVGLDRCRKWRVIQHVLRCPFFYSFLVPIASLMRRGSVSARWRICPRSPTSSSLNHSRSQIDLPAICLQTIVNASPVCHQSAINLPTLADNRSGQDARYVPAAQTRSWPARSRSAPVADLRAAPRDPVVERGGALCMRHGEDPVAHCFMRVLKILDT